MSGEVSTLPQHSDSPRQKLTMPEDQRYPLATGHEGVQGGCRLHYGMDIFGRQELAASFSVLSPEAKGSCDISPTTSLQEHARGAALRLFTALARAATAQAPFTCATV